MSGTASVASRHARQSITYELAQLPDITRPIHRNATRGLITHWHGLARKSASAIAGVPDVTPNNHHSGELQCI